MTSIVPAAISSDLVNAATRFPSTRYDPSDSVSPTSAAGP
jgi:hypothetical protein